ncbi:MAG TPA: hypothetical protein DDY90_06585 [Clostridiales bacterium]|nr:hypothetical protein [Clostridiales bacterium]HBK26375.1 hypothetical protein [Clostridiales bacterium]HCP71410.1 hypothetical protein [Clostridiales bacterium]
MTYTYSYISDDLASGLLSGIFSGVPTMLIGIATYVLGALALYTIAKRRGLNHPWLAWIPVASVWIVGSLSDQYRYVVNGENKSKRKVLLTLNIITFVLSIVIVACAIVALVQAVVGAAGNVSEDAMLGMILGPVLSVAGLALPLAGVAIAYAVVYYMALYDIFKSLDPNNCVLFLVLSIVFGVTEPFFLFFNRNKDGGMPPRRPEPACIPPEPNWCDNSQDTDNTDFL